MESFKRLMVLLLGGICLAGLIGLYAYFWFHDYYRLVKVYLEWWGKGHALLLAIYGILLFFFFHMYGGMRIGYLKNAEVIFPRYWRSLL